MAAVRADLREWLEHAALEREWIPWRFELAFGLAEQGGQRDPESRAEAVALESGIQLRGSIDLVERTEAGALRVTDFKTGKARARAGQITAGGTMLQPVLYALAVEQLFPGVEVRSGRLYYCTATGGFSAVETRLDEGARRAAGTVARVIGGALAAASFPRAPAEGACTFCDFVAVCGPDAEERAAGKPRDAALYELRTLR